MNRISFNLVQDKKQIKKVEEIARIVWSQHYAQILEQGQIDFMLEKYQSAEAIERQIQQDGYAYYIISSDGKECGYFAFTMDKETLFLSKIYVMENYRKQGIASQTINFLRNICIEQNLCAIWLTVNKNNEGSIQAYQHLGFQKVRSQTTDIGEGYVMDDYIMQKVIS